MFLKLKYAMNWLISSNMKIRPARHANVSVIALITSSLLLIVPAPRRSQPGREEDERDDEDQAVHERRVADHGAGLRITQRRARDRRQQADRDEHGSVAISAYRRPFASASGETSGPLSASSDSSSLSSAGSCVPRLGSTMYTVTTVTTNATTIVDAIQK